MEADKNLHAKIPPALLAALEKAAQAEHMSVDELVQDVVERRLQKREWRDLLTFGEKQAKSLGLRQSDVERLIAGSRQEKKERGR